MASSVAAAQPEARALILVTEPDPQVKLLQRYFLETAGFDVEFASDGEEGLELARARLPRILITAILLPTRDGLSVCRALKSDTRTSGIKVLVFSVLAAGDRAVAAGADAFLRKPLDDEALIQTVHGLLEKPPSGN